MIALLKKYVVFIIFVGLLIIGGLFALDRRRANQSDAATKAWVAKVAADDSIIADLSSRRDSVLTVRTEYVPVYTAGKDRIIREVAGNPTAEKGVTDAFELADRQKAIDDAVIKADSVLIKGQAQEIVDLKNKPEPYVKRAAFRVGIGYSAVQAEQDFHSAPAVRGGVDYRIAGPVSVSADVQMTMPGRNRNNPMLQETILVNIKF